MNKKPDTLPLGPRPKQTMSGLGWIRCKVKATRDAWSAFTEKSARTKAERKASYAVFAKHAWDKARTSREEASKKAMDHMGDPRRAEFSAAAKSLTVTEAKAEIACREARFKASCAAVKAALITGRIAKANYKDDPSEIKNTAAAAAKLVWEKAVEQAKRDKAAVEAVKELHKAAVAHTKSKEKEKAAIDRCHQAWRLLSEAEAAGLKTEVQAAKAEVETVIAKSMLDWAREDVVEAKINVIAASDPISKTNAETELDKAQAHAEVTMVAFARSKEKYALAQAKVKPAADTPLLNELVPEVNAAKKDFSKNVWDHAEAEAARAIAKAEVELAEIVWAKADDAAAHAIARSEHTGEYAESIRRPDKPASGARPAYSA